MFTRKGDTVKNLSIDEFEKRLAEIPEETPDEWDNEMLAEIDAETDSSTVTLEEVDAWRKCNGKISLRVPKELHYRLLKSAKENGVSLNQFIMYKLSK